MGFNEWVIVYILIGLTIAVLFIIYEYFGYTGRQGRLD
jgi:hypothetical protein